MPVRPPHPCAEATCGVLVASGSRCPSHALPRRPGSRDPLYRTPAWRALRRIVLTEEPWCRTCHAEGRSTRATDVDHIVSTRRGGAPLDRTNLRGLCHRCHSSKTAKEDGRWGRGSNNSVMPGPRNAVTSRHARVARLG